MGKKAMDDFKWRRWKGGDIRNRILIYSWDPLEILKNDLKNSYIISINWYIKMSIKDYS